MKLSNPNSVAELRHRAAALAIIFSCFLGLILIRLWYLQIWKGEEYRRFSDRNRFKIERLAAPRGQIIDRNGQLLADNRPRFDLQFTRAFSSNIDEEIKTLAEIFQWDEQTRLTKQAEVSKAAAYRSVRLARDITWDQLAQVQARSLELSGVDIDVLAVRDYLYGDSFFHSLGYTGEINEADLIRLSERYPERGYRLGDEIGVIGAEAFYERFLRGVDGREFHVVDVRGRPVQKSGLDLFDQKLRVEPQAGKTLQLTLDLPLQLEAIRAFGSERGAAVAISPQTGELLALVSRPALDPNIFTREVSGELLRKLRDRADKPFLDRSVAEHYPPGSTFKLIMATAALELGVIDTHTKYFCPGYFRYGRRVWRCHKRQGHGHVDLRDAIKKSCDVFFYNVGLLVGLDRMHEFSRRFGLGKRTHLGHEVFSKEGRLDRFFRFNFEQAGFIPDTRWVQEKGHTTIEGETINAGIGQGGYVTTVIQLARMVSIFANNGTIFQPQLVKNIRSPSGKILESYNSIVENRLRIEKIARDSVLDGMFAVVNEPEGTALGSRLRDFNFGGKTGTAQVVSLHRTENQDDLARELQDHALFVGLAPIENPQIAVAVVVENGGSGSRSSAPIAKAMVQNYLNRHLAKLEQKP